MKCVRIEKRFAEEIIFNLKDIGVIDESYSFSYDACYVYIPLKKGVDKFLKDNYEIIDYDCELKENHREALSLRDYLLKKGYKDYVKSFDIIGSVAIVEIPEGLSEKVVAEGIVRIHKNIKTIYSKGSGRHGQYRLYDLKLIYGPDVEVVEHRENGLRFLVDVKNTFFSPRASNERKHVAEYINLNGFKKVMVFFAGIGPYCIVGAKYNKNTEFYGIELNKRAYELFQKNVELNKLTNVHPFLGDVKDKYKEFIGYDFDCVIMPLPKECQLYFDQAIEILKDSGIIIAYLFLPTKEYRTVLYDILKSNISLAEKINIIEVKEIDSYSAFESKFRVVIKVFKT
ncbi:MAG: hypothetical protein N3E37_02605 [Candidatus Micrarchaeota archaeon]|nr:hypothetical protein [Candidatus Micrarchaeota archaeon]